MILGNRLGPYANESYAATQRETDDGMSRFMNRGRAQPAWLLSHRRARVTALLVPRHAPRC